MKASGNKTTPAQAPAGLLWRITLLAVLLLCLIPRAEANDSKVILLATHPEKQAEKTGPEQNQDDIQRLLACIFKNVGLNYEIVHIPWARAKRELSRNSVDGIFLTSFSENTAGVNTQPIYLEKWFAFSHKNTLSDLRDQRIGVIRESDIAHWLNKQGINPYIMAASYQQLVEQFNAGRFDVFIADIRLLERASGASALLASLHRHFVRYMAKGLTFSAEFVRDNPELVRAFNNRIKQCNPAITDVNAAESAIIRQFAEHAVISPLPETVLARAAALAARDAQLSDTQIVQRDKAWQENIARQQRNTFMQAMMDNPVSAHLRKLSENVPEIKEVFITDEYGVLLGTSALLSDYYQGDEEKVTALTGRDSQVSDISFDASTGNFISHYSRRLQAPDGTALIAIVGLSLDDIFRGHDFTQAESAIQAPDTDANYTR
ncbi:transporter substrate-binding domain-containing protein [Alteromonas halophila]|uniref:Solute-binding protein family 3/N-terminal domain-containing protein n=1 Tax=Alteromonas halophila TaxID=516698 RepID=A0A918JDB3_9ALTE|nr:hypothetical protein [Alteromonas halophila]GGW75636.1 hypothetical protein GCM10007391_04950 [Alteromonas halophila]